MTSLADLGARVDIEATRHTTDRTVAMLLVHYRRWHGARALGPLSSVHRSKVLSAFECSDARDLEHHFVDKAHAYRVSSDTVLSAMALALAFCPAEVRFDNWPRGQEMLRALIANPTLVVGAYLAKLAKDIGRSPGEERVARGRTGTSPSSADSRPSSAWDTRPVWMAAG
ncbi:hypothetical protein J2788_005111 [Variovorax paradoxus]|nr:hypothetical protein [Variovorax paradoxus]